jgi:hypothetical protein
LPFNQREAPARPRDLFELDRTSREAPEKIGDRLP